MKLNTPYKTVLFYGHVLRVGKDKKYIAADKDGSLWAHRNKPALGQRCWYSRDCSASQTSVTVTFESSEHWENTLTYCGDEHGQDWMLDLKMWITVVVLGNFPSSDPREMATYIVETMPRAKEITQEEWEGFVKHSGVKVVVGEALLEALAEELIPQAAPPKSIKAEKPASLAADSLVVRNYYGGDAVIPDWVRYLAMDADGWVWCFENQPEIRCIGDNEEWQPMPDNGSKHEQLFWRSAKTGAKHWKGSLREVQK